MRLALLALALLTLAPAGASAQRVADPAASATVARLIEYRAHDGRARPAWLWLPVGYHGQPIPLVISPHGRGVRPLANALLWGDLPGLGGFAVVNPGGEGRRTHLYSWGDRGEVDDLARMPEIARRYGVNVDRRRIYCFGGSMGGQETLLLVARHPRLLAGAAAFDPATDMARRYRDFAGLPNGRHLQRLAREEIGGTPQTAAAAYAARSPATYAREIALSGVPLQLFWSLRDRVIADQHEETGELADELRTWNPDAPLWTFRGEWHHTAEMRAATRLPRALARFGLLDPRFEPPLPSDAPTRPRPRTL
jgi:pimeloyl-ACP methyl ester carboxylesterase